MGSLVHSDISDQISIDNINRKILLHGNTHINIYLLFKKRSKENINKKFLTSLMVHLIVCNVLLCVCDNECKVRSS